MQFKQILSTVQDLLTYDPYELLKELNIDLVYDNDLTYSRKAILLANEENFLILLRTDLCENEEEFLLFHEIAHFLLHKDLRSLNLINSSKFEREADYFACLCLLHGELMNYNALYLIDHGVPSSRVHQLKDAIFQYLCTERYGEHWQNFES